MAEVPSELRSATRAICLLAVTVDIFCPSYGGVLVLRTEPQDRDLRCICATAKPCRGLLKVLGPRHPSTLSAAYGLAVALGNMGKHKEAAKLLRGNKLSIDATCGMSERMVPEVDKNLQNATNKQDAAPPLHVYLFER